jgi:hypothetical protein
LRGKRRVGKAGWKNKRGKAFLLFGGMGRRDDKLMWRETTSNWDQKFVSKQKEASFGFSISPCKYIAQVYEVKST